MNSTKICYGADSWPEDAKQRPGAAEGREAGAWAAGAPRPGGRRPDGRPRRRGGEDAGEEGARKGTGPMRIVSWNVNGIRACAKRGFAGFLDRCGADVLGVQEVRALPDQIPDEARAPAGWRTTFSPAERLGYSGVGLYARPEPERVETSLGEPRFDVEGRFVAARFRTGGGGRLAVVNCYFPKGSGKDRDNSRVPYKLDFYRAVFDRAEDLRREGPVLVIGDYNTAHREIDLARPRANVRNSGFLPEERAELDRWIEAGWTDAFRALHPDEPDHYSWWAQRGGARARNVGWRIDYVLASPEAMERVRGAFIWPDEHGSDHCPVGVDLDVGLRIGEG